MRYPNGHNDEVRARIVEIAGRALRKDGLDAVSIPKLMKLAGLTHGGFYVHFKDRDELVAAAVEESTRESAFAGDSTLEQAASKYLSQGHVAHPEMGCVIAALGVEGSRQKGKVRRTFAEAARRLLSRVERKLHPESPAGVVSDDTLLKASQMLGAVILARLMQDDTLAARLLASARNSLLA
jgi:TetR/AcrR family transcriptional regulator, transcriptional repressor for nem operon